MTPEEFEKLIGNIIHLAYSSDSDARERMVLNGIDASNAYSEVVTKSSEALKVLQDMLNCNNPANPWLAVVASVQLLKMDLSGCENVYHDLQSLLKRQTKYLADQYDTNRWIPVTEKLPEDFCPVLTYGDNEEICVAHLELKDFRRWYITAWNNEKIINVTHWKSLPLPPETMIGIICL